MKPSFMDDPIRRFFEQMVEGRFTSQGGWLSFESHPKREQGWKLHLSATVLSAVEVLERSLPILLKANVPFKVAANLGCLNDLNEGHVGISQVGKFVTVYPDTDEQAVQLAIQLEYATTGLKGPQIPSDRSIRPGSIVHYRYGGFTNLEIRDSLGQTFPAIRDLNGRLVVDERKTQFESPPWVLDPFVENGVAQLPSEPSSNLFNGYLILSLLKQNAKGGIYLALDPSYGHEKPRLCVIKEGRHHLAVDPLGRDICDRLHYQSYLLKLLFSDPEFPDAYDFFELEDNCYLVMEYIEGQNLQDLVLSKLKGGCLLSTKEVITLAVKIAKVVRKLHDRGWILRDLTPTNITIDVDQNIHILDLELVYELNDPLRPFGWGTPGYTSPQQSSQQTPTILDDIYSFGATLFFLTTGSDPSFTREGTRVRLEVIRLCNAQISESLASLIVACMDPNAESRPTNMDKIIDVLNDMQQSLAEKNESTIFSDTNIAAPVEFSQMAIDIGEMLIQSAESHPTGICWGSVSTVNQREVGAFYIPRHKLYSPNLHNGVAGIGMFLITLAEATGLEKFMNLANEAGAWVSDFIKKDTGLLPGLHFGKAGALAFLYRLGQTCRNAQRVEESSVLSLELTPECTSIPDITHGWAGIGLLHLLLARSTEFSRHLELAISFGDQLVASAERIERGVGWRQPPGDQVGFSNEILNGFAHGTAGIAYYLLELWHATGKSDYLNIAKEAARGLIEYAQPSLDDDSGINWPLGYEPKKDDSSDKWFFWCHGATGIGLFFLKAYELTRDPEFEYISKRILKTISIAGRRGGGVLCHGLAGNGCFLVEGYRIFHEKNWLESAFECGILLEHYSRSSDHGRVWPAEHPSIVTPDLMVGYSGVGEFFLRLAQPIMDKHKYNFRIPVI